MSGGLIVAVCGESGAGKSTTVGILEGEGFVAWSLSALLRAEAEAAVGRPTRAEVQAHGKAMQALHGNDYYARRLVAGLGSAPGADMVIDGLRNLDELACLRRWAAEVGGRLWLLALVLEAEARFARVTGRGRAGDPTVLEQFRADDARANGAAGDFQNNRALIDAADWQIGNDGDQASLANRVRAILQRARTTRAAR